MYMYRLIFKSLEPVYCSLCVGRRLNQRVTGKLKDVAKLKTPFHVTMGIGVELNHSEAQWRQLVRQAWLLGFLNREIGIGKGNNMMQNCAFCTFFLSSKCSELVEAPHEYPLPLAGAQRFIEVNSETQPHKTATRKGKGCLALPQVSLKSATYI